MRISGRHIRENANLIVDGRRAGGTIRLNGEIVKIQLDELPGEGMHLLQVQNPGGLFSNDFIFHVTTKTETLEP